MATKRAATFLAFNFRSLFTSPSSSFLRPPPHLARRLASTHTSHPRTKSPKFALSRRPEAHHPQVHQLLNAIQRRDQNLVWKTYVALDEGGNIRLLTAEDHSEALRSFRLKNYIDYGSAEIERCRDRILYVLERMQSLGHKPDVRDFNFLLEFFGRVKDAHGCETYWSRMRELNITPNVHSYNLYLYAAVRRRDVDLATWIYSEIRDAKVRPTAFTHEAMIEMYGGVRNASAAMRVFNQAFGKTRENGLLVPTVKTFNALLSALGESGEVRSMVRCYEQMMREEYKVIPNLDTFNTLIRWLCERSDMRTARRIFNEMQQPPYNLQPNIITFRYLVRHETLKRDRTSTAWKVMRAMREVYSVNPLGSMFRDLIRQHLRHGREEAAQHVLKQWREVMRDQQSPRVALESK
ncbi:uncharacterized protein VTP21DRAFT_5835 [Calcarisporiella thermophila]|uniref:uncharacterized protein n=1 Tax=Calcarisporiella thermophila TaxID=911321 RepID=UPI0037447349